MNHAKVSIEILERCRRIAALLLSRAGDIAQASGTNDALDPQEDAATSGSDAAEDDNKLAEELEQLGPTFVKLGQILSTRADLLPAKQRASLSRLQESVAPVPFEELQEVLELDLGVRISKAFAEFDETPTASASLGQVHRARLRDGRHVAVKIRRPGIREEAATDLAALDLIVEGVDQVTDLESRFALRNILDEFRRTLAEELDYRREAEHLKILGANLTDYPELLVPQPIDDYCSQRVLTMEWIDGTRVTDLPPVRRPELEGNRLVDALLRSYLDQILVDGFVHADPHPGNILLTPDDRLVLLDLGMVARIGEAHRLQLLKLVLALSAGKGEVAADICIAIGERLEDCNESAFRRDMSALATRLTEPASVTQLSLGRVVAEMATRATEAGIRPAPEVALLGKALLSLDSITEALAPGFDSHSTITKHIEWIVGRRAASRLAPKRILSSLLELEEVVEQFPRRVNQLLDAALDNRLEVRVHAFDQEHMMSAIQKVANRISLGLVLAALIVGAAMLMDVDTSWKLFGYPGLAISLFLIAAICGLGLVFTVLWGDIRPDGRPGPARSDSH